ncbi:MAG: DUF2156 domain-containing protein [Lachnospiraceae bacterium]|nr:DUF2156 domain-containing protein [Lachnospiraceae bacterium]MBQ4068280.1 DUF2156 domain-containing protein [Lachnospiraceae bacterium]
MKYELHEVIPEDYEEIKKYFKLRNPWTCENIILDAYLWKNYYDARYIKYEKGIIWIYRNKDELFTCTPLAANEDLRESFELTQKYFNEELGVKLHMYLVDEEAIEILNLSEDKYIIEEDRDYFDYIYDAEKLRNLSGKKYHKKKNHVNAFKKEYEGRYEFRLMCCMENGQVREFLDNWIKERQIEDEYNRVDAEAEGIYYILDNCHMLKMRMGGVFIDGKLEAFSIGSYSSTERMAYIHVEKANPNIRGLYPFINMEFLRQGFEDALYVNREDDMGLEGLRKAKLSYHPIKLVKKYNIIEK